VIAGDGCLQEGISHEAIDLAGHLKLKKLIVLWDDNEISIDGATSLSTSMNQPMRFKAAGWEVQKVDGHDPEAVAAAIEKARKSARPSLIACRTTIGKGAPTMEGSHKTHGAPLGKEEIARAREALNWPYEPFTVPASIKSAWETVAARGGRSPSGNGKRHAAARNAKAFDRTLSGDLPESVFRKLAAFRKEHQQKATKVATRQASQMALEVINGATTLTIGGSADLTGSNLTQTSQTESIQPKRFKGRYVHYGIREHAMAAVMNGLSLHGGFIPYGGTFLVFSDYARGGMRLSALMEQGVVYVLTHDSIGLGEDGPTHQPVEHLAMLRATPNINVYRPADIIETAECWELALRDRSTPSVLALSRQGLPMLRETGSSENLSARGAYVLHQPKRARDVTLLATGSEVEIARKAADNCSTCTGSAPQSSRCRAGRSSRRRIKATATRCSAPPRALRLKPLPGWAGIAGSVRRAHSSAWTGSVRRRRPRSSTNISASPPNGSPVWRSNLRAGPGHERRHRSSGADGAGPLRPEPGPRCGFRRRPARSRGRGARVAVIAGYDNPGGDVNPTLSLRRLVRHCSN
jgi:transketolase